VNGFTIVNPDPNRIGAIAARAGLRAIKSGMRLNRAYTPTNCRRMAEKVTGKKFKARDYDGMIAALTEYLEPTKLPDVAVWHYPSQQFITHIPCEGERRVRIDVHDSLDNYAVFEVTSNNPNPMSAREVTLVSDQPLTDWQIDLS
jgi:hypothetical protein